MTALSAEVPIAPVDPGWGEDYLHGRVAYISTDGIAVWMRRKGQRVRFYDARGVQRGPEHGNVYSATIWAAANSWIDPDSPSISLACILEVRGQMVEREAAGLATRDERDLLAEFDAGAWRP